MKRSILLTALLAFMACEDKKEDNGGSLTGTWELSNSVNMPTPTVLAH